MYNETAPNTQHGLFSSPRDILPIRLLKQYEDSLGWHNLFHEHVTCRIDESTFSVLYSTETGRPNASIRVLVGMMVLKEGLGISDEQLFENCRFNLLFRKALGLMNMDDPLPTESTYYLFRRKVMEHAEETGENLFDTAFSRVTAEQSADFAVSGTRIRMDSKLLGSNIAWLSRYELVHQTMATCLASLEKSGTTLRPELKKEQKLLLDEPADKVVHRHSSEEVAQRLRRLGRFIYRLLEHLSDAERETPAGRTLQVLFAQQFDASGEGEAVPREAKDISARSIQSPHDEDARYRKKGDQKVKGYSVGIAESCDDDQLNLIGAVDVRPASAADQDFLPHQLEEVQRVFADDAEVVHADGGYQSQGNQELCEQRGITARITALPGRQGRCRLVLDPEGTKIIQIIDGQTGESVPFETVTDRAGQTKWRIATGMRRRHFTRQDIDRARQRRALADAPAEELKRRNNVEATIFQLGYHYPHDKTRYRGLVKHQMWANMRCMWINFVRIRLYLANGEGSHAPDALVRRLLRVFLRVLGAFGRTWRLRRTHFGSLSSFRLCASPVQPA